MELYNIYNENNQQYPIVISIPHSSTYVPEDIRSSMYPNAVLANTDWFLKELYDFLPAMGITVISSNINRYVIDLNRDKIKDKNGEDFWTRLVYTHNTFGTPLYAHVPSEKEIQNRIEKYYDPYHQALKDLIAKKLNHFEKILLLDLHSFCVDFIEGASEDIILSNYENETSTPEIIESLGNSFTQQGYSIGINTIRGRYILKNYKKIFGERIDCIQMELRYAQYIDTCCFGEEELHTWDQFLFSEAKKRLQRALTHFFKERGLCNEIQ